MPESYRTPAVRPATATAVVVVHCSDIKDWIPNSLEIQILDDSAAKWAKVPATWNELVAAWSNGA